MTKPGPICFHVNCFIHELYHRCILAFDNQKYLQLADELVASPLLHTDRKLMYMSGKIRRWV